MTKLPTVQHDPHADEYTKAYRAGQQAMLDEMTQLLNTATTERDALAAQVGALKDWRLLALQFDGHRMQAMSTLKMVATGNFNMEEVRQFIAAAPVSGDKHLAEIRAQAAETAIKAVLRLPTFTATHGSWLIKAIAWDKVLPFANQYADSIRRGEVK